LPRKCDFRRKNVQNRYRGAVISQNLFWTIFWLILVDDFQLALVDENLARKFVDAWTFFPPLA